jgi:chromatin structure-remodeling complex protein RSC7
LNNAGVYDIHTNVMQYPTIMQPTHVRIEQVSPDDDPGHKDGNSASTSGPVPLKMARNFYVTDTYLETPPIGLSSAVYDKTAPSDFLASFNGLSAVPEDVKNLLPPECRAAFDKAIDGETEWKSRWGLEKETMSRRDPIIDKAIVPYSMS